jgi:predicted permease
MSWLMQLISRRRLYNDLSHEMQQHLEEKIEELVASGMPRKEATSAARRAFGNLTLIEQDSREVWQWPSIESFSADVRYALRTLRKNPGFTAVAVLTLALGIGANAAMFSVVEGVLLAPLPYSHPDQLVVIWENNLHFKQVVWPSYPNFKDWQRSARSFQRMAAVRWQYYDLTSPGSPEHLLGAGISSSFLDTLDARLPLGRNFSSQEDQPGGAPVAIIGNELWKNRFAGNPQVAGKSVTLNGVDYTVIGVLPPRFHFGDERVDVYTPLAQGDPLMLDPRGAPAIISIARLNSDVSMAQALAEMSAIQDHLVQLYPDANKGLGASVVPLRQVLIGDVSGTLLVLFGAVGLVLLIACANVANLLLARSVGRTREFAIRAALGASRSRTVRQLLTESILLSLGGAVLGLTIANWGVRPLLAGMPGSLPRSENIGVNTPVFLFTLFVSIAVAVLFGLAPALKNSKTDLQSALKHGGRGATTARLGVQNSLVILQMALTLMLLVGAGLLFRTIHRMSDTNPGFDAQRVITFKVGFSPSVTKTASGMRTAYRELLERLRTLPAVQAADFTYIVPLKCLPSFGRLHE